MTLSAKTARIRSFATDLLCVLALAVLAGTGTRLSVRRADRVLLDFGPNDADFVKGFRADWERDGPIAFRWTGPAAEVRLPLGLQGDGFVLRLRARRHFPDPAHVRLLVAGRTVGRFDLAADPQVAYRVLEFPLPAIDRAPPFVLLIEAPTENPRPLGIALDWMELERRTVKGTFALPTGVVVDVALIVVIAFLVSRLAGLDRLLSLTHALILVVASCGAAARDPFALERVAGQGLHAYVATAIVTLMILRWHFVATRLAVESPWVAGILATLVMLAVATRLSVLFHPRFYYPDVVVHARFVSRLVVDGFGRFMSEFKTNQFRYSLGLQFENGHWYAFPYPPVFYLICGPLVRFLDCAPLLAVKVVPAVVNGLEVLLVYAIGRRLGVSAMRSLLASAFVPLLPVFLARVTLGLFPALVGHAVDMLVVLFLLSHLRDTHRWQTIVVLAGWIAVALLTYTQSLLTFGAMLPLVVGLGLVFDWKDRRRHLGLAASGVLGTVLALVMFYGRYVPTFLDIRNGIPMPEERVLIEKMERAPQDAAIEEPPNDPYAGPGVDLVRGTFKIGSRLRIFYGPFAPLVVMGVTLLIVRIGDRSVRRFALAWAATFLLFNLASGGLPGPNLFRHNKDVETAAPLFCIGLSWGAGWLFERGFFGRLLAAFVTLSFVGFGVWCTASYVMAAQLPIGH